MSLAGVILALGDMVDSACVLVETAHKKSSEAEREGRTAPRSEIVIASARELGPSMFGALLVVAIAFYPCSPSRAKRVGSSNRWRWRRLSRWRSQPCSRSPSSRRSWSAS